ncbi:hypothetical protein K439DRAFT_660907 [Ramaria rubella]|nr:hypothetical protein K439DRAFT_660907 [Ramaria rubella]
MSAQRAHHGDRWRSAIPMVFGLRPSTQPGQKSPAGTGYYASSYARKNSLLKIPPDVNHGLAFRMTHDSVDSGRKRCLRPASRVRQSLGSAGDSRGRADSS